MPKNKLQISSDMKYKGEKIYVSNNRSAHTMIIIKG